MRKPTPANKCGDGVKLAREKPKLFVFSEGRLRRRFETPRSVARFLWQSLANAVTCPDPTMFRKDFEDCGILGEHADTSVASWQLD
jgi:hypothetical protein